MTGTSTGERVGIDPVGPACGESVPPGTGALVDGNVVRVIGVA